MFFRTTLFFYLNIKSIAMKKPSNKNQITAPSNKFNKASIDISFLVLLLKGQIFKC